MKAIKQWFEELPEPYRSQALENMDIKDADTEYDDFEMALTGAFLWHESPEGWDYWNNIRDGKFPDKKIKFTPIDHARVKISLSMNEPTPRNPDVTVKTVNEEAVIKSNREIAEEIFAEIFRSKTADLYTNINSIEAILNKYIKL